MKLLKKLRTDRSGFTLGEVMACMLILLLITAVVAGALPAATSAYYDTVDSANAQVLLSTTISALRDELGTAGQVRVEKLGEGEDAVDCVVYRRAATGSITKLYPVEEQGFELLQYAQTATDQTTERLLVTREAATGSLYAACSGILYDDKTGVVTFQNLIVTRPDAAQPLASAGDCSIRVIDPS